MASPTLMELPDIVQWARKVAKHLDRGFEIQDVSELGAAPQYARIEVQETGGDAARPYTFSVNRLKGSQSVQLEIERELRRPGRERAARRQRRVSDRLLDLRVVYDRGIARGPVPVGPDQRQRRTDQQAKLSRRLYSGDQNSRACLPGELADSRRRLQEPGDLEAVRVIANGSLNQPQGTRRIEPSFVVNRFLLGLFSRVRGRSRDLRHSQRGGRHQANRRPG